MAKDKNKTTKQNPVAVRVQELTQAQKEKRFKEKFKGVENARKYFKTRNLGKLDIDEAIRAERERR